jgi:hypothetical protein
MKLIVQKPLEVPIAEFLTYFLFHKKRLGTPGYKDYLTIGSKLNNAVSALDECIEYNGTSICRPKNVEHQLTEISEHIGEAIGLSVANRIHGLTEADWSPLEPKRGRKAAPSFDFQFASDGKTFIQVENKGSSVQDNSIIDKAVEAQKGKIDKKKAKLATRAQDGSDPYPASLRYGTIAAVDSRQDGNIRCWLTDPAADQLESDPTTFRLLSRMRYIRDMISFISPRSTLASAMATRVVDLEAMSKPEELDGIPLMKGNSEAFDFTTGSSWRRPQSSFMFNRSKVSNEPTGGVVVKLSDQQLMFLGVREELIANAAKQHFGNIVRYRAEARSAKRTVECVLSKSRFARMEIPGFIRDAAKPSGNHLHFQLSGTLNYSPGGLVFGILPVPCK